MILVFIFESLPLEFQHIVFVSYMLQPILLLMKPIDFIICRRFSMVDFLVASALDSLIFAGWERVQ